MYRIKGQITGVADLLFNQMTVAEQESLRTGSSGGKYTDDQRYNEALLKYPREKDTDNAVITSWMFKQVLAAGAKAGNIKEGRKNLAWFITATVFVDGPIRLTPDKPDYIHEVSGKRPPKTGGACLIKRPAWSAGWTADFVLAVVDDRRDPDQIRRSLEEAGILCGIGSWRPEYGRFILTSWEVIPVAGKGL